MPHLPDERAHVAAQEALAVERAQPAPYVALAFAGPPGNHVLGLPTEGSGPNKSLTPQEVHARFTRGQYTDLLNAGWYRRLDDGTDEPDEDPAVTAMRAALAALQSPQAATAPKTQATDAPDTPESEVAA